MRYSDSPELDAVYCLVASWSQPDDPDQARLDEAMTVAGALAGLGEDRSWASVWWAYGAVHYDMSDEALDRALDLLARVDHPDCARAAALMLQAEIEYAKAVYAESEPSHVRQRDLLARAVSLAPDWPSLRLRLARASKALGDEADARDHGAQATALLAREPTVDPFDSAIAGRNLDRDYVRRELELLGVVDTD
jgi:hypothetical protein